MEIRMATSSVAIVQNSLADRDPDLAIIYVLVMATLAFPGGGGFLWMRGCFHDAANGGSVPNKWRQHRLRNSA